MNTNYNNDADNKDIREDDIDDFFNMLINLTKAKTDEKSKPMVKPNPIPERYTNMANNDMNFYKALRNAGFTDDVAIELLIAHINSN